MVASNENLFHFNEDEQEVWWWCFRWKRLPVSFTGFLRLSGENGLNSGVLETSEKRECGCVGGGGGGGRAHRKKVHH